MEKRGRIVQRFPTTPFETSFPYFPQQRWPTGFVHKFQLISGMTPSQEESILSRALGLPEAEREAFLVRACAGDADLKKRVVAKLLAPRPSDSPDSLGTQTPTLRDESTPLSSPVQTHETLGRYRIRELIGEGGCGVVYVAEQTEPVRREVAIKVIKMGMDTKQVVARFEAERQALALMDHPCIAKVLDAGATDSGRPYFVMELIRGIRITTYCEREALSISKRLELFIKVCQAIQHAHQKGIIHRDIKPSNILVARHDDEAVPKVIDFGIAKALPQMRDQLTDSTVFTQVHQFIGTPAYMSPEQATMGGVDIDTRTDIYSLGVVLYELLCGVPPFDAQELLKAGLEGSQKIVQEREPTRPSLRLEQRQRKAPDAPRKQIPTDLDWIVMKCLEKDRNRRYETANGLAMDIERFLHHEPVVARSPTTFYRLQKAWRRNRGLFAMGVTAGLSLASASIISTWQWIEAVNARNKAEHAEVAEREARLTAVAEREKSLRLLYAANIQLIQQAWEHNNLGRMRALLQDTATSPGRGFEWFY
ncbi:MAG: serine/threonine protein kinase [Verrucomicrobia bacterium]|nr:serine/threonine protein kinase [Verrucomicrobiota bacterium]